MREQSPDEDGPRNLSQTVAAEVKAVRAARGMSAQQLANRLDRLGVRLSRGTIAKIESGLRGVSMDEVVALAVALNVTPLRLLVPVDADANVEVTPGVTVPAGLAWDWFTGQRSLPGTNAYDYYGQLPAREAARFSEPSVQESYDLFALMRQVVLDDYEPEDADYVRRSLELQLERVEREGRIALHELDAQQAGWERPSREAAPTKPVRGSTRGKPRPGGVVPPLEGEGTS